MSLREKIFRPFEYLIRLDIPDASLDLAGDDINDLLGGRGEAHLLFGHYGESEIHDVLERYGMLDALRSRGLADYRVRIDAELPARQSLRIETPGHELICEMILGELRFKPGEALPDLFPGPVDLLVIKWICMQDPTAGFSPARLPLPGQSHPGLGVGRRVMEMLLKLAERLEVEGIVNRPQFLHNATLYEPYFIFLHPEVQGRFEALCRDLDGLSFSELAWAAEVGAIADETGCTTFTWFHGEQLRPTGPALQAYFDSPDYQLIQDRARLQARFTLDRARLEHKLAELRQNLENSS